MFLDVCHRSRKDIEGYHPRGNMLLISITDPNSEKVNPNKGWVSIYGMSYMDTIPEKDAEMLVRWLIPYYNSLVRYNITVHCEQGIERSKTIAKWISDNFLSDEIKTENKKYYDRLNNFNDHTYIMLMDALVENI